MFFSLDKFHVPVYWWHMYAGAYIRDVNCLTYFGGILKGFYGVCYICYIYICYMLYILYILYIHTYR